MSSPHVAIMGFYGIGNYGDDLMAHLFASHLTGQGIPCTLLSLGDEASDTLAVPDFHQSGLASTRDPAALLSNADILVWGGGGMLVSKKESSYRRRFHGVAEKFEQTARIARAKGVARCAVSVGGNELSKIPLTPRYKQLFLDGAGYVSVRNASDLALLQSLHIPGDFFPDVVWRTGNPRPLRRRSGAGTRIGLDLYLSNLIDQKAPHFVALLQGLIWRCPDITFVCLDSTHRNVRTPIQFHRWFRGRNVEYYRFHDFNEDASMLASLDLLVSSRLHVPVVALGHHVPVIWTFCEAKTRVFLRNNGLAKMDFGHGRLLELTRLLSRREQFAAWLENYPFPDSEALYHASGSHLQKLVEFIHSVRGTPPPSLNVSEQQPPQDIHPLRPPQAGPSNKI